MEAIAHASLFSLFGIVISAAPMVAGLAFALRPSGTRMALVRALTLVGVFVTGANALLGGINALMFLADRAATPENQRIFHLSLAETMVVPFIGLVFLAVGWIGVAIGLRKPVDG